uniref:Uncharacterized protein n=1 Tax=Lotus japonicus TaxID=34305 RepID=I3SYQ1_LOTJA|nr:unknown [Lotus japonicus]
MYLLTKANELLVMCSVLQPWNCSLDPYETKHLKSDTILKWLPVCFLPAFWILSSQYNFPSFS